jgi:hypothetical protein
MDIDTTLRWAPDGSVQPLATTVDVRLSGGGDNAMLSLSRSGRRMSLSWPGKLPVPVLTGDTAEYRGVLGPDVDLRVRVTAEGVPHALVVKTPSAAADPRLALVFGVSHPDAVDSRKRERPADHLDPAWPS